MDDRLLAPVSDPPEARPVASGRWTRRVAVAGGVAVVSASSALAGVTVPTIDLGFDATDLAATLQGYLVPFLVGAISVGFAFWAVRKGVNWIKGMIG
jgi:hypothetical protein